MKKITQKQIYKMLEEHKHWLNADCENWETMKADFSCCDLSYTDLIHANLRDADLSHTDLGHANLRDADLSHTDLGHANLRGANLRYANLSSANLSDVNLSHTDLGHANLRGANLRDADLRYTDLSHTDLIHANLSSANLSDVNLSGSNLRHAKEVPYIPMVCPEEGDFIGWKKAGGKIVKLRIPEDALRSSATTRKCRCNKAEVVEIYNIDGTIADERIVSSSYDSSFTYEVGKTVEVQDFDTNRWNECSRGIHFFINRQEAIN